MSAVERFRQAWDARFPSEPPPDLPCLQVGQDKLRPYNDAYSSVYGTVYSNLNPAAVEQALQVCNATIAQLYLQLERQQFVAEYLWEVLHSINTVSVAETQPPPLAPKQSTSASFRVRVKDGAAAVPLETDLSTVGSPTSGLDNIVPIQESPSSCKNFSPLSVDSVDTKVFPDDKTVGLINTDSSANPVSASNSTDLDKCQRSIKRKHSLPLLDREQNDPEFESETERTVSLDSGLQDNSTVADSRQSTMATPVNSFRHQPVAPSPSLPGQKAHRQKPVPTPRVTVNKQAAASVVNIEGGAVGESLTDDVASGSGNDSLMQRQRELKRIGGSDSVLRNAAQVNADSESMSSADDDHKVHSVKQRALAFTLSAASNTPSSVPGSAQKLTVNDNLQSSDSSSSPRAGIRRTPRVHVYEEVVLDKEDVADSDDGGTVSSDDEEPLYYNLKMLQQTMLNRAKTFYSKGAQRPTAERSKLVDTGSASKTRPNRPTEDDTHQLSGDSIRSIDSDAVFDEKSERTTKHWRKRPSMYQATDSTDSMSEPEEIDTALLCPEDEKLQMRKWVISSVLESEKTYLGILDILMQYMQTFRNCVGTPQSVLQVADIDVIFHGIPELHMAHKFFVHELDPRVSNWSADQQIGELFFTLSNEENKIATEYLKNYQKAVFTIRRCWQENEVFAGFTKEIQVKGMTEKPSLEELLHKPVVRFQRNTLVLHDLIKCTPTSHADYDILQNTLSSAQYFIENFDGSSYREHTESPRYLAKQGLIVEKVGNTRKLRHMFLFNDVLVCARQKISAKQRITYEPKWTVPLVDLSLDDKIAIEEEKQLADCQQAEIEQLQRKVSELQGELKSEMKHSRAGDSDAHRQWSFHSRGKNMEKIKKKLVEQQAAMIKASPRLLFRVHNRRTNRLYTLLMASDYERSNWRFTIAGLLSRAQSAQNFSVAELHSLLNSQKLPKVSGLGALISDDDIGLEEELLFGNLNIKIFKLNGLKQATDTYCAIEVDSFGHFFMKAKTDVCPNNKEPTWNQEFDIDLEGAQTVRFLCYRMNGDVGSLISTCALELSKAWLRGDFLEKTISLSEEMSLTVSLRLVSRQQTIKRTLSSAKGGVFGARIRTVAKREGTNIPLVVATCIQEVSQRGMCEVGVYRISGVSGEIQRLKKAFEKNGKVATQLAKDSDIHVITGLLKLYLRELPESLFTDALYPNLVTGMGLSDPEAKEKYLLSLMESMPEPNHSTVVYLIDHLISVAENEAENKMSLQNLATVFGPTVLRPAVRGSEVQTMEELFSSGTRDAMMQTSILMTFLNLHKKGAQF